MRKESRSLILAECGILIAMSFVLSFVKIIDMPYGGSVTAFSMLPVMIAAYRHGLKWGLLTGFAYSILQLFAGFDNIGYATSPAAAVAIIMLDYIVAFTCTGLLGAARRRKAQSAALTCGAFVICVIRYICHIISGCTVWAGVSIPTGSGLIYSVVYNGAYMIPETVVTVAAAWMISEALDFRGDRVSVRAKSDRSSVRALPFSFAVAAVVVDFLLIFRTIQTEDGFNVARIAQADWLTLVIIFAAGIALTCVAEIILRKKNRRLKKVSEKSAE